jgi:hypothetical protein
MLKALRLKTFHKSTYMNYQHTIDLLIRVGGKPGFAKIPAGKKTERLPFP